MSAPHDFEFQLGRNRNLKGRGWRGLFALCLFLSACVAIAIAGSDITSRFQTVFTHIADAR